jgi:hypothetical protein
MFNWKLDGIHFSKREQHPDLPAISAEQDQDSMRREYDWLAFLSQAQPGRAAQVMHQAAENLLTGVVQGRQRIPLCYPEYLFVTPKGETSGILAQLPAQKRQLTLGAISSLGSAAQVPLPAALEHLLCLYHAENQALALCSRLIGFMFSQDIIQQYIPDPTWINANLVDFVKMGEACSQDSGCSLVVLREFSRLLNIAQQVTPCIACDPCFSDTKYTLETRLRESGRAVARYQTEQMIATIWRKSACHDLDRGLWLSLPYFDDPSLEIRIWNFDVIPAGWVPFMPAFVVVASIKEQALVRDDNRLNLATKAHLIAQLRMIEKAFDSTKSLYSSQFKRKVNKGGRRKDKARDPSQALVPDYLENNLVI